MNNVMKLTNWVISKIEKEYKDDVALLVAVQGHSVNQDGHGECFDYFIPATERGYDLARTFIIDGIGHDLYPRTWEQMERTAGLEDFPTFCLANAHVLYARTPEDEEHFLSLQKQLFQNMKDGEFTYGKALEKLDEAMDIYRTLMFEQKFYLARMAARHIQYYLTQAVAFVNGTFADFAVYTERQVVNDIWEIDKSVENQKYYCPGKYYCSELKELPENFFVYGNQILKAESIDELRQLTYLQIQANRKFLRNHKPEKSQSFKDNGSENSGGSEQINYQALADWYQELSLTWKRLRYFCDRNMAEEAFEDAGYLQSELIIVAKEFQLEEMDLLGAFVSEQLEKLKIRSMELENQIRLIIEEHGIRIDEYESVDDFLMNGSDR